MVWLVFGIPLASLGVGGGLVVQAVRAGGAEELSEDSPAQPAALGPDPAEHKTGLLAVVRAADGTVEVLPASDGFDQTAPLRVTFTSPAHAGANLQLQLQPIAHGWRSEAQIDRTQDWHVQLSPSNGGWQLLGNLPHGQPSAQLMPAPGHKDE
jgi:hypothetical protein